MADETPLFSSHPIEEDEDRKPRRKTARKTSSGPGRARRTAGSRSSRVDTAKIERQLDSIYRDDNGRIPNMREIKVKKGSGWLKKTFVFLLVFGLLVAAAWTGFFMIPKEKFAENQVSLVVSGPEKVMLGATTTYSIKLNNGQKVSLTNLVLSINYPESFVFVSGSLPASNQANNEWKLANLEPNKNNELKVTGFYFGSMNKDQSWRVSLHYQPENFNSNLQKSATLISRINSSPYTISFSGPDKIAIGGNAEYTATIEDKNGIAGQKFVIQNELPNNFIITSSSPNLDKKNNWSFTYQPVSSTTSTPILPLKYTFKVAGKFTDSDNKTASLKTSLYLPYTNGEKYLIGESAVNSELIKNAVSVNLAVNGSLDKVSSKPGEPLNITLAIKNDSKDILSKVQVRLAFDAPSLNKQSVLDWSKLDEKLDGNVVGKQLTDTIRRGQITWTSKNLSDLASLKPAKEAQFEMQIPLKDTKTVDWSAVKENKITVTPEVTFNDSTGASQTVTGKSMEITINSDFGFETRDEVSTSGSSETHNITWVITNSAHPLKNVSLSADLYGDIKVTEPINAPAGKVSYDKTSKKLTWEIPQITDNTDVLALPFSITLNQKNPTQNLLVSRVRIQAEDTVTGEKLDMMGEETPLKAE